jgi:GxxExxY protein
MDDNSKHSDITGLIIKAFFKVYNVLGYGFLEKVYENAMIIELRSMGLECTAQGTIRVYYSSEVVGLYNSDLFVEESVIVELKAARCLAPEHEAQLINYLKATDIEVGMLLNFGPKPEFRRKVFSNARKKNRAAP